jgi:hypothetical protein
MIIFLIKKKVLIRKHEMENNSLKERIDELEKYIKINVKKNYCKYLGENRRSSKKFLWQFVWF